MIADVKKRCRRSFGLVLLICLVLPIVPAVQGQQGITSILHLRYPSQAVLQNGVAEVSVTFTMYFDYYSNPQGYLVFGVYGEGTSNPVQGSATSTPDPCQPLAGTPYASDAVCAIIPPTSAGTESASITLTLNQAQQYSLSVVTFVWDSRNLQSGNQISGSTSTTDFTITVTGQAISTTQTAPSSTQTSTGTTSIGIVQGNVSQPISFQAAWGSYGNGTGQFSIPTAVAVDSSGNVYVTDTGNDRVEKFTSSGAFISQWGSAGTGPGQFNKPWGIAVDPSGNVYVTDTGNSRVQKFTGSGTFISQWGTRGSGSGQFSLLSPVGIAVDSSGDVYVVDTFNFRVEKFTASGSFLTQFGSGGSGPGQFSVPNSVAVDSAGNVFVTDAGNFRVEQFAPSGTFSSMFGGNGTGPGQFTAAYGIATDSSGNVYVVDGGGARVEAFSGSGTFLFQWPCATGACPTGTGLGQLNVPYGVAITSSGLVYVTDGSTNQVDEFSITSSSSIVTTSTSSTTELPATTGSSNLGVSGLMSGLQQNGIIISAGLLALGVVLVLLVMRGRKRVSPRLAGSKIFCIECGTANPTSNTFCKHCGTKLSPPEST